MAKSLRQIHSLRWRYTRSIPPCAYRRFLSHSASSKTQHSEGSDVAEDAGSIQFSSRVHPTVERIIRVNHAGEFGAERIYAGQAAVLGKSSVGSVVQVQ